MGPLFKNYKEFQDVKGRALNQAQAILSAGSFLYSSTGHTSGDMWLGLTFAILPYKVVYTHCLAHRERFFLWWLHLVCALACGLCEAQRICRMYKPEIGRFIRNLYYPAT